MFGWVFMGSIVFVFGFLSFISRWKHILAVLLSLEMMMVGVYSMVVCNMSMWGSGGWLGLIFLGFAVCEGAMGLGLVVSLVRSHGGDCLLGFLGDVGYNF